MYDFDLHMRFLRSAADAWFNYSSATVAACAAWQNHISNQLDVPAQSHQPSRPQPAPVVASTPFENPFMWWSQAFLPVAKAKPEPEFGAGFFQFSPMHAKPSGFDPSNMFNPFNAFAIPSGNIPNPWLSGWMEMMAACSKGMPQFSWNIFQGPMTAWLMSAGLPYDVAVPTARGNAATMDAAVAAREGFDKMYASFRTDGGHAVAPILSSMPSPMAMLLAPYWALSGQRLH